MKWIMGIICLIVASICYFKPELLNDINMVFGCIFINLACLYLDSKK